jgi:hypothetical protein
MPKWSNRSIALQVRIYYTPKGRAQITIPAPLIAGFDKPEAVTFIIDNGEILVKFKHSASPGASQTV